MIKEAMAKAVKGEDLTEAEMQETMTDILTAKATPAQSGIRCCSMQGLPWWPQV